MLTKKEKDKKSQENKSNNNIHNWDAEVIHGNAATGEQYSVKRNVQSDRPITREMMEDHWKEMDKEAEKLQINYPNQVVSAINYQDEVGNQIIRFTPTSELIFPVGVPIYDEWGKQIIGRDDIRAEVEKRREEWARWEKEGRLNEQVEIHHTDDGKIVEIKFRIAPKRLHPNEIKAGTDWIIEDANKKRRNQLGVENNPRTEENENTSPMLIDKPESLLTDEQIEKANKDELKSLFKRIKVELEKRKTEQNSGNFQVSSQQLERQSQKIESVLNNFQVPNNNSPKSNSILPIVGVVGVVSLFGGLIIWKKDKK